jgi:chemotaxis protein histidine kinase CheA
MLFNSKDDAMKQIRKQSAIARRRLIGERFLSYLPWTSSFALIVAAIAIGLPKLMHLPVEPVIWFASWIGGCAVLALIVNSVLTFIGRPTLADAAVEIDRRFGLRERISSVLVLSREDRETELGQALAADAENRASKLDVRDKFTWGFRRSLLLPVLPILLAAGLWYVPNANAPEELAGKDDNKPKINQIKNATKPLLQQIKKQREAAEKNGLSDMEIDFFKKLEGELAKIQKDNKLDTKQSLAKLNDIKEQLEQRRSELGSSENLKKNLQGLEKFEAGPAEKLADAMKQGDFEKAEEALKQMMKKMESGQMSPAEQQQLQKQLEKLEQAMAQAAQAHEQNKQALKEQIKKAEAAGDTQQAAQLQRKLEQTQAQDAQMAQMQKMADSLSKAQQAMKEGDMQSAKEQLGKMASQMQQMNQQDAELKDLDELMDSLSQSKSQMACKECDGDGCSKCMNGMNKLGQKPGKGMGQGKGQGDRPEEETDADFFDSRLRDKMKKGETVYGGQVGGENRKGTSQVEVQDAVLASLSEEPEPLDDTPLPKLQREHTREYFNAVREGKK